MQDKWVVQLRQRQKGGAKGDIYYVYVSPQGRLRYTKSLDWGVTSLVLPQYLTISQIEVFGTWWPSTDDPTTHMVAWACTLQTVTRTPSNVFSFPGKLQKVRASRTQRERPLQHGQGYSVWVKKPIEIDWLSPGKCILQRNGFPTSKAPCAASCQRRFRINVWWWDGFEEQDP